MLIEDAAVSAAPETLKNAQGGAVTGAHLSAREVIQQGGSVRQLVAAQRAL
jgi:hypothetical protein